MVLIDYYLCCLVTKSCPTLVTTMPVACKARLYLIISSELYWNELPFPSLEDLPDPGFEPTSALAGRLFTSEPLLLLKLF